MRRFGHTQLAPTAHECVLLAREDRWVLSMCSVYKAIQGRVILAVAAG